ncbi:phage recombination protein Bet [Neomegalonema sp.]|uniref:phage recombination protein Bet n=1 Tax=Neomegalonema sp. TaxID=2039713 RepID=UPI00262A32FA|nr:phage recombination protein Bet [Neomegalonema sp.]MDD2869693.1 phage recombination protein Bet [Neomegalonema sp.]
MTEKQESLTKTGDDRIELIKKTVANGTTDNELKLFLYTAQRTGLDPLAKQIYAIRRWSDEAKSYVMTIQTGIDGYRLIAERTGNYAPGPDTTFVSENGKIVSATAHIKKRVGMDWFDVTATAYWEEYAQFKKDGTLTRMWKRMPHAMLSKCAEALALRRAFPAELSGLYTHEEMMQADVEETKSLPEPKVEPLPDGLKVAELEQRARMESRLSEYIKAECSNDTVCMAKKFESMTGKKKMKDLTHDELLKVFEDYKTEIALFEGMPNGSH